MRIKVLGAAAGGGFPQWNCGCPNCRDVRSGALDAKPLTQERVAVAAAAARWIPRNASAGRVGDIESNAMPHPRGPPDSPMAGIVPADGGLGHCLGLLSLRESRPPVIYATERVRRGFPEGNVLYRTLERFPGQV